VSLQLLSLLVYLSSLIIKLVEPKVWIEDGNLLKGFNI